MGVDIVEELQEIKALIKIKDLAIQYSRYEECDNDKEIIINKEDAERRNSILINANKIINYHLNHLDKVLKDTAEFIEDNDL